MVRAWFMKHEVQDPHAPNELDKPCEVSLEQLRAIGVDCHQMDTEDHAALEKYKTENKYKNSDRFTVDKDTSGLAEKLKIVFEEHLHSDEEVRFIVDGSGYFDVRDLEDRWIRILVERGDLLNIPSGIYHRFTLDHKTYIDAIRLFAEEPVWTPHNRPADDHPARVAYLRRVTTA